MIKIIIDDDISYVIFVYDDIFDHLQTINIHTFFSEPVVDLYSEHLKQHDLTEELYK